MHFPTLETCISECLQAIEGLGVMLGCPTIATAPSAGQLPTSSAHGAHSTPEFIEILALNSAKVHFHASQLNSWCPATSEQKDKVEESTITNLLNQALKLDKNLPQPLALETRGYEGAELILFFHKVDEFRKQLESGSSRIKYYCRDYNGPDQDAEAALQYFTKLFLSKSPPGRKTVVKYCSSGDKTLAEKLDTCMRIALDRAQNNRLEF
ncbi:hypothetical protein G7Y89_g11963 [Cudoniella acicularis]|uniref:Uncharacterized protein n=1 Tax=Cudoniella acicularis TaxID=354080 RepID=A0A8H4RDI6_9HELO|nr:hypothetical protein G7Y89_g11963 [Cudoniella acicularis]